MRSGSDRNAAQSGWEDGAVRVKPLLRVRKTGALMVAAVLAFVGAVPFASAGWAYALVLLIPVAVFFWAWRAGTDVFADELRVRALFGSTRVPWSRVTELAPDRSGQISALLDNGNVIRLTGVTRDNLPQVLAAGGQEIGGEK
jgi:hypothetical protein